GDYAAAVQAYTEALALAPENARTFGNLGLARRQLDQGEQAQQAFDRAQQLLRPAAARPAQARAAVPAPECGPDAKPPVAAAPERPSTGMGLEVANGNGVAGMARKFAARLVRAGFP